MRKPVFEIFDQVRLKLACSATESNYLESWNFELSKYLYYTI